MNALLSQVERLDQAREEDVRLYEEAFYRAFAPRSNPGIRTIWIWDDKSQRLKTRIPYEDQDVFFIRDERGLVETGLAVNRACRQFQSGAYGFQRPQYPQWVEVLAVFNLAKDSRKPVLAAVEKSHQVLLARGWEQFYVYATCPQYSLNWNLKRGWEIAEKSERDSVIRYFLRMSISRSFVSK